MTLRELQRAVKRTLDERFEAPVWVSAEISEIKVNYSGHCYLELVEKGDGKGSGKGGERGGANGVPTAQARAVIWSSHYPRISGRFAEETGQPLAAGLQILAKVFVSYHEIYGFSLQITDIDPSYTLGDMERQRQQTILQLQRDGVWEMNRQLDIPAGIQRIAVVSSARAAGYRDFCKEIEKSPYRIRTTLFEAFVQGAEAENSIVEALCAIAARAEEFDAVALIRGGGSKSDLNCFNAYRLCSYVAQFPLPVVTGIGHDQDTSVADMVAAQALKTPTAVAAWFVERLTALEGRFDYAALGLRDALRQRTHAARLHLERLAGETRRLGSDLLTRRRAELDRLAPLPVAAARELLARSLMRLDHAREVVAAHDPERLVKLGFALVHSGDRILTRAADAQPGNELEIRFADGTIKAKVQITTLCRRK